MPNLLSQLLNPAMMAASGRWPPSTPQSSTATNASQVPLSAAAPTPPQHHHHHLLHNVMHQQHHNNAMQGATGGGGGGGAEGGSATRFQFIVPGEQVDLYG